MKIKRKAIVLLSGGLDSTTCCALAKDEGFSLYTLSFYYGQRHQFELTVATQIAQKMHSEHHKVVKIDPEIVSTSSLTSAIVVPKNRDKIAESGTNIPNTYVPARNTLFLSHGLAWAEVIGCTDIFIGVNAIDYSGYPDCRPEYIAAFEKMANLATKAGIEGKHLTIHTPLIHLTKAEIIHQGLALGVDYSITHSCYDPSPEGLACGSCDSCRLRKKGFSQAGTPDPTKYQ